MNKNIKFILMKRLHTGKYIEKRNGSWIFHMKRLEKNLNLFTQNIKKNAKNFVKVMMRQFFHLEECITEPHLKMTNNVIHFPIKEKKVEVKIWTKADEWLAECKFALALEDYEDILEAIHNYEIYKS